MILALDPSSSKVGYAVMRDLSPKGLVELGLLVPSPQSAPPLDRTRQLGTDLADLIQDHKRMIEAILIEVSLTPHGHANDHRAAATLGVYGLAVGYLLHVAETQAGDIPIETAEATIWTERKRKPDRTRWISVFYGRAYLPEKDPGGDTADAIGVGRWWLTRRGGK